METPTVVVNADDLGLTLGVNDAIETAHIRGIVTSASLMANMPAYDDAVRRIVPALPDLGVGLHLTLTEGRPVADAARVPLLVDAQGCFNRSFVQFVNMPRAKDGREAVAQVTRELEAQFEKATSHAFRLSHIDGHQHVHMVPWIFAAAVSLAKKHGIKRIRVSDERFVRSLRGLYPGYYTRPVLNANLLKKTVLNYFARDAHALLRRHPDVASAAFYFGVLHSCCITRDVLRYILSNARPGLTEITVHPTIYRPARPGEYRSAITERSLRSPYRQGELAALTDPALPRIIGERGIRLTSFTAV